MSREDRIHTRFAGATAPGIVLAGLLGSACADVPETSDVPTNGTTVRDSAGIEIIANSRTAWEAGMAWQLDSMPEFVIKTDESLGPPEFIRFKIGDVIRPSDGRIVVENRGSSELFVFDMQGRYIESWGGMGEGPGQFRRMNRLFECGSDTLFVQEDDRATMLDGSGETIAVLNRRRDVPVSGRIFFGSPKSPVAREG